MPICVIFGGAGYIGTKLATHFLNTRQFEEIHLVDIKESNLLDSGILFFHKHDVRFPIDLPISFQRGSWIFNLAAVHREPGHVSKEYFETNILGATHVCEFAKKAECRNLFFTSSISVYGPTIHATGEATLTMPNSPYGISKLVAEKIHEAWAKGNSENKLIIVRPGVIFGPDDPGNILRMIKAVKRGYFFLPVTPSIKKSYGYVFGLIDSIRFAMEYPKNEIVYNYVEEETESLGEMVRIISKTLSVRGRIIRVPLGILLLLARIIQKVRPGMNGIHPDRVKKVARPTHIVPQWLMSHGFKFNFPFEKAIRHWKLLKATDF